MKVVFVNLSDAFLPGATFDAEGQFLSAAVEAFNKITRMTRAVTVIKNGRAGDAPRQSSAADRWTQAFLQNGVESQVVAVIPETPGEQTLGGSVRGWLDQYWNEISSFVLLGSWDDCSFQRRCIEIDPAIGLTETDAMRAVSILNDNWIEFE